MYPLAKNSHGPRRKLSCVLYPQERPRRRRKKTGSFCAEHFLACPSLHRGTGRWHSAGQKDEESVLNRMPYNDADHVMAYEIYLRFPLGDSLTAGVVQLEPKKVSNRGEGRYWQTPRTRGGTTPHWLSAPRSTWYISFASRPFSYRGKSHRRVRLRGG